MAASNDSATNSTVTASNSAAGGTAGTFTGTTAIRVRPSAVVSTRGPTADVTGDVNGDGNSSNDGANADFAASDDTNNGAVITANTLPAPSFDEFFVESPDMKNVYDGVVTTDVRGMATVELPAYSEALNRSFATG